MAGAAAHAPGSASLPRRAAPRRAAPAACRALPARRELLAGGAALLGAGVLAPRGAPPALAADLAAGLPLVPRGAPLGANAITPSAVIKGCWQLGGGHRGDAATDRTCAPPQPQSATQP
jgi:hypothetical protein